MLCQFMVSNFRSYRDETIFDMQAANIEEFRDSLIPPPGENFSPLLPVSVLYGPNGGGKTTLFEALSCLSSCVMAPITASKNMGNPFGMLFSGGAEPFRLDEDSAGRPTAFEIVFRTQAAQYHYQINLAEGSIVQEALYRTKLPCKRRREVLVFEREGENITAGSALARANTRDVSPTIPYLSFLAINYRFSEILDAVDWFSNCCIINYSVTDSDRRFSSFLSAPHVKKGVLELLGAMDIPIADYEVQETTDSEGKPIRQVETIHRIGGKDYRLNMRDESDGTCKILSMLPAVLTTLTKGGLLLADELDSKLHPQLLRFLLELYTDPEVNAARAQLVFTCQDISIMKNDVLRRDEIWFAARDEQSVSRLWSLYELRDEKGAPVKSTAAYDKQYLAGRYGADPYLRRMLNWRAEDG